MTERHRRDHAACWLLLQQTFGTGTRRAHLFCERYGGAQRLLSPDRGWLDDPFFSEQERRALRCPDLAEQEAAVAQAERLGAVLLTPDSPEYPQNLRHIHAMPLVLWAEGELSLLQRPLVTMVGTRNPDAYGRRAAKTLAEELASLGAVVVSGLAVGIDGICHEAALDAGGTTAAILAAGLAVDYPRENRALRSRIRRGGLLLTEYSPDVPPLSGNFPVRNRLLSGISAGTVAVQTRAAGGTMLTARRAIEQGKPLFAVPDGIFSAFDGAGLLLGKGAKPALSGRQVLADCLPSGEIPVALSARPEAAPSKQAAHSPKQAAFSPEQAAHSPEQMALSPEQAAVLAALAEGPETVSQLCERCALPAGVVLAALTALELLGLARLLPGRMAEAVHRL